VLKKDKEALRLVHSLEPLNAITIRHSGVPPIPESHGGTVCRTSCGATLDLYVGYDERLIAETSRDLTTSKHFWSVAASNLAYGMDRSVPVFHDDVHIYSTTRNSALDNSLH